MSKAKQTSVEEIKRRVGNLEGSVIEAARIIEVVSLSMIDEDDAVRSTSIALDGAVRLLHDTCGEITVINAELGTAPRPCGGGFYAQKNGGSRSGSGEPPLITIANNLDRAIVGNNVTDETLRFH